MRVIIADDITGAGDSGIHFAAAGRRIALLLNRGALADTLARHEMVTLSTESRFQEPEAAAETVRQTLRECRAAGADAVYKKIDSTLRGNPGAEIAAMLDGGGFRTALVCPAMPKTGRAVRDGKLLLHGRPLDSTEAGNDPFNPVPGADVAAILAAQTDLPVAKLPLAPVRAGGETLAEEISRLIGGGARILVADAVTDGDLANLAAVLRRVPGILPAGAGGFAEAMAGAPLPYAGKEPRGRMLAVVGSLTKTSLEQIDYAAARGGFQLLDVDEEPDRLTELAACGPPGGGVPLLLKNRAAPSCPGGRIDVADGIRAAEMFAEAARAVAVAAGCAVLYVTGGSTAMAVLRRLGVHAVTLEREYMPGVVMSSFTAAGTDLRWFISKAGGFGEPDTIVRLAEATRGQQEKAP